MPFAQKKKLTDKLGSQWSKEELERFYEAYRMYGKDWKKVCFCCGHFFSHHPACLLGYSRAIGLVLSFSLSLSCQLQVEFLLQFSVLYFDFQVAGVVRNRTTEMVEALYNMNRVNQYY